MTIKADSYKDYKEDISIAANQKKCEVTRDIPMLPQKDLSPININDYNVGDKFILRNVYFDTDKSVIRPESVEELNRLLKFLVDIPTMQIELSGHTDDQGNDEHNKILSEKRSKAVMDYLIGKGIDASRLKSMGYGSDQPIATNSTDQGRQKNRRTEIRILAK